MSIKQDLDRLGETIEYTEKTVNQKEGALKTHKDRLKKEFSLADVGTSEKEVAKLTKQLTRIDKNIKDDYAKLTEAHSW